MWPEDAWRLCSSRQSPVVCRRNFWSNARLSRRAFSCAHVRKQLSDAGLHSRPWPSIPLTGQGNDGVLPASVIGKRCKSHAAKWRGRRPLVLDARNDLVFLEVEKVRTQHVRGKDLF